MRNWPLFIILSFCPVMVFAEVSGIGDFATSLMEPVSILSGFINSGAIIIGFFFIFGSIVRYIQYRQNPLAVPLSNVVLLLILGIVLLLLPLSYKLVYDAPPYKI